MPQSERKKLDRRRGEAVQFTSKQCNEEVGREECKKGVMRDITDDSEKSITKNITEESKKSVIEDISEAKQLLSKRDFPSAKCLEREQLP